MNRICLVALIGLPAAGKTTLCNYLMKMESLPFNILHLCYDYYVKFNMETPAQYKEQRKHLLQIVTTIIIKFKNCSNFMTDLISMKDFYRDHQHNDVVILCDDNHYYRSMRYKLYQLAREHNIAYYQIYFESNLELTLQRNSLRSGSGKVPRDVIVEMSKRLETPNASVYKWEENTFTLKNFNMDCNISQTIIAYIKKFLDVPVQPLPVSVSKVQTPQSLVHDLDLLLRKHINLLMDSKLDNNKKILAKKLNDKRKDILKQFQLDMGNSFKNFDLDLNKYVEMLNFL